MPDITQSFKWVGITREGQRKSGILRAIGINDAQNELKKMGIEVINLTPHKTLQFSARQKKIKVKDIQLFTRYLSTMLSAGLPIIQALEIISSDKENPALKNLVTSLKNDIAGGKGLAESFSTHPKYFNSLYCSLLKAGEKSGTLDKILNRLALYLEKTEILKRKIKKSLAYPIAILSIAFIVSGILLLFVVPQFKELFASFGATLPFFTLMVVNLSEFIRTYWWAIGLVIISFVGGVIYLIRNNEAFRETLDRWSLKIFIIGPVLKKGIIARFTRTLATTLEAGMPIVDSIKSMKQLMGSYLYSKAIDQITADLTSGHNLSVAMNNTNLFPNMVIQMIAVGEVSGRLPEMLTKIADYYEDEVNTVVDNLSTLLEPIIMLVLGIIIGSFIIAMYLPIFKIGSIF